MCPRSARLSGTTNSASAKSLDIFIGQVGTDINSAPTVKKATSFGNIRGLAPEDPTKQGGYYSASVAYYGHEHDLNSVAGDQKLNTFAVALASPLPKIEIPVRAGMITLVPFAKSVAGSGIDAAEVVFQPTNQIVDFYVDTRWTPGTVTANSVSTSKTWNKAPTMTWTPSSIYEYKVTGDTVDISLKSEYAAGGIMQHMGYVISGTTCDGIYLEVRDYGHAAAAPIVGLLTSIHRRPSWQPAPAPATTAGWDDNVAACPSAPVAPSQPGSSHGRGSCSRIRCGTRPSGAASTEAERRGNDRPDVSYRMGRRRRRHA